MLAWLPECGCTLACSAPKMLLGPFNGQALHDVHVFAAAIPAFAGVAFGVFIGQHRPLRLHHGGADRVLAGNQLDVFLLPLALQKNRVGDVRIHRFEPLGEGCGEGSILLMRLSWRPPSNCAPRKASRILLASLRRSDARPPGRGRWRCCAGGPGRPCFRPSPARRGRPGILLAAMLMPMPVAQINSPKSLRPPATASPTAWA